MSYAVVRIQKYQKTAVKGIQFHNQRERESRTNPDIDSSRSQLNYDLMNTQNINLNEKINERIQSLNLPTKVRKDAIVLCECLITSDQEYFKSKTPEETKSFFEDALSFVKDRYGEENIMYATVHNDEATPHLHIGFTPVIENRLSAKKLINRIELSSLHTDFEKKVGKQHGLIRGEIGSGKKHLATQDFKIAKNEEKLEKTVNQIQDSNQLIAKGTEVRRGIIDDVELEKFQSTKKSFLDQLDKLEQFKSSEGTMNIEFENIKKNIKKTLIGDSVKLKNNDFEALSRFIQQGFMAELNTKELKARIKNMEKVTKQRADGTAYDKVVLENEELSKEIDIISEKFDEMKDTAIFFSDKSEELEKEISYANENIESLKVRNSLPDQVLDTFKPLLLKNKQFINNWLRKIDGEIFEGCLTALESLSDNNDIKMNEFVRSYALGYNKGYVSACQELQIGNFKGNRHVQSNGFSL